MIESAKEKGIDDLTGKSCATLPFFWHDFKILTVIQAVWFKSFLVSELLSCLLRFSGVLIRLKFLIRIDLVMAMSIVWKSRRCDCVAPARWQMTIYRAPALCVKNKIKSIELHLAVVIMSMSFSFHTTSSFGECNYRCGSSLYTILVMKLRVRISVQLW